MSKRISSLAAVAAVTLIIGLSTATQAGHGWQAHSGMQEKMHHYHPHHSYLAHRHPHSKMYCKKRMKGYGHPQVYRHGHLAHPNPRVLPHGRHKHGMYGHPPVYGTQRGDHKGGYGKYGPPGESYGTAPEADAEAQARTIVETAEAAGNFKTLLSALAAAGLTETLSGEGPFTVFAPTDAAFTKLPMDDVAGLLSDTERLKSVLTYHVAQGNLSAADLLERKTIETVQGGTIELVQLNVSKADVATSNGTIHVIDDVLFPVQ